MGGFMDYQTPPRSDFDPASSINAITNIIDAKGRAKLNDLNVEKEKTAAKKEDGYNQLATEYAKSGNKEIFAQMSAMKPEQAKQTLDSIGALDDRNIAAEKRKVDNLGKLTFSLATEKDDNRVVDMYQNIYKGIPEEDRKGMPDPMTSSPQLIRDTATQFMNHAADLSKLIDHHLGMKKQEAMNDFTGDQNDLNRANTVKVTGMNNDTSLKTTRMNNDTSVKTTGMNNATSVQTTGMNNQTSRDNTETNADLYKQGLKGTQVGPDGLSSKDIDQARKASMAVIADYTIGDDDPRKIEARNTLVKISTLDRAPKTNPQNKTPKVGTSPYHEGQILRGKDGKMYEVKNGQPVPR